MTAKRMIITTNRHPSTWYKWEGRENQEVALKRRFVDYGFIMANTKDGLDKVDPEDFWPIAYEKLPEKVYRKLGEKRNLNDVLMLKKTSEPQDNTSSSVVKNPYIRFEVENCDPNIYTEVFVSDTQSDQSSPKYSEPYIISESDSSNSELDIEDIKEFIKKSVL